MHYDKVLVTGGAGFIGSHTVDSLLGEGVEVWVLDDLSTGRIQNLRGWKTNPKLHVTKKSTVYFKPLDLLSRKVDAIVHLAAVVSPYVSVKRPESVNMVNVSGTINVLRASVKNQVNRLVFASSSSVYGNQATFPISEENPLRPVTPYGASKVSGEKYCEAFSRTYGLSTISLRYFNVYGERQSASPYSGVIAIFAKQLTKGLGSSIYGDGEQTRDFIHISDVARANITALETSKGTGEAFNIGTGQATSINRLFSLMAKLIGKSSVVPTHSPNRQGDIRDSYANMTKTEEALGFHPEVELEQGLKTLIPTLSSRNA